MKGPSVFKGYFKAPELTREKIKGEWFNTGDVVRIDEEGYLTILDRATDIIIVGGFNVYPTEVEGVLQQMPGSGNAPLWGVEHPVSSEDNEGLHHPFGRTEGNSSGCHLLLEGAPGPLQDPEDRGVHRRDAEVQHRQDTQRELRKASPGFRDFGGD